MFVEPAWGVGTLGVRSFGSGERGEGVFNHGASVSYHTLSYYGEI